MQQVQSIAVTKVSAPPNPKPERAWIYAYPDAAQRLERDRDHNRQSYLSLYLSLSHNAINMAQGQSEAEFCPSFWCSLVRFVGPNFRIA